jgi:hypothetical protein
MATFTSPNIETQLVVTGTSYQLAIAEADSGSGITRIEIGPYHFEGAAGQTKFPEAPTNEMCPDGWQQIQWVKDNDDSFWLRWEGGILLPEFGERIFQFTSNFPPSSDASARLRVWRGSRSETFQVRVPDYSQKPPARNSRHDSTGFGQIYQKWGCLPQVVLIVLSLLAVLSLW